MKKILLLFCLTLVMAFSVNAAATVFPALDDDVGMVVQPTTTTTSSFDFPVVYTMALADTQMSDAVAPQQYTQSSKQPIAIVAIDAWRPLKGPILATQNYTMQNPTINSDTNF